MKINKGFTLIELLVAVSILVILATVGLVSFQSVRNRANDAKIRADLDSIKKAYEQNFDPSANGGQGGYKALTPGMFADNKIPTPDGTTGTSYVLVGPNATGRNSTSNGFLLCSPINGATGTCSAPSSTCHCVSSSAGSGTEGTGSVSYAGPCTNNCAKNIDGITDCVITWTPTTNFTCNLTQTTTTQCYYNQDNTGGTFCNPAPCTPGARVIDTCSINAGYSCVSNACTASPISKEYQATTLLTSATNPRVWSWTNGITIPDKPNRLLLITIGVRNAATPQTISSVTLGTQSLIQMPNSRQLCGGNNRSTEIWYLVNPSIGTKTLTVNGGTVVNNHMLIGAVVFSNVNQSLPFKTTQAYAATGYSNSITSPTIPVSPGEVVFDTASAIPLIGAVGSGQTSLWHQYDNVGDIQQDSSYKGPVASAGNTTMSYSLGFSQAWVISAVVLKPLPLPTP